MPLTTRYGVDVSIFLIVSFSESVTICYSIHSREMELLAVKSAFFIGSFTEFSLQKFDVKELS